MREVISTYAPGVKEVFAAVDVQEKSKAVEFESKLFSSKSALSGLREHSVNKEEVLTSEDGMQA